MSIKWAYGVTTVPQRQFDLLPETLNSLREAGFPHPRLFIDGVGNKDLDRYRSDYSHLEITARQPQIRTYGNWVLGLAELYIREPNVDRYAMFQDDFVTYKNLKDYLNKTPYPEHGYWNLYTFPSNQALCPSITNTNGNIGIQKVGWYPSNQFGRGAVALVFDRETVLTLLTHQHMVERPMDCHRGWKSIDGGIVTALLKAGWTEYVHNPSLVQHTGMVTTMRNKPHKAAISFRGENFNAMELLDEVLI